jgi:hypothetical protein
MAARILPTFPGTWRRRRSGPREAWVQTKMGAMVTGLIETGWPKVNGAAKAPFDKNCYLGRWGHGRSLRESVGEAGRGRD